MKLKSETHAERHLLRAFVFVSCVFALVIGDHVFVQGLPLAPHLGAVVLMYATPAILFFKLSRNPHRAVLFSPIRFPWHRSDIILSLLADVLFCTVALMGLGFLGIALAALCR